ncbi:unnamed protein product [Scytosiphon promiscuus]
MARSWNMLRAHAFLLLGALAKASSHLPDLLPADDADGPSMRAVSAYGGEYCPPCEALFTKLETLPDGSRQQRTRPQLRGEPKSGTTFMFSWAYAILAQTCEYLQDTYGSESCHTEKGTRRLTMIFEPKLAGGSDARCPCDAVDRVEIDISELAKHIFPIDRSCPWYHRNGIPNEGEGCWTVGGRAVENAHDVWSCMEEASCTFKDEEPQYVAMRDPRAVAVSTHFYVRTNPRYYQEHFAQNHTLDETVMKILPQVCHLTTLRHILFSGIVPDRSEIFWYEDALQDPFDWHHRWMSLAGLFLPRPWVDSIVASAGKGKRSTKFNPHPGGEKASVSRTWRDEVSPEILDNMDDILRTWLPGVLLARFNVPL